MKRFSFLEKSNQEPQRMYSPQIPKSQVEGPPKHRIVLVYNQDNTWDAYLNGEFLFDSEDNDKVLKELGILMQTLD